MNEATANRRGSQKLRSCVATIVGPTRICGSAQRCTKGEASVRRGNITSEATQTSRKPMPVAQMQRSKFEL